MYGHRARIGYTSPPIVTEVFPYEFYQMVPKGVTLVVSTLAVVGMTKSEIDKSYDLSVEFAREMARAGVDLVVLGGAPINLSRGFANVDGLIKETEQAVGVPVTTSITAQIEALRKVGAKNVAVAHPFAESYNEMYRKYVDHYGFNFSGMEAAGETVTNLGRIPIDTALKMGRRLKASHPLADTIWYSCPHWAVSEAIDVLERELDVSIVTANQAIVWHALRRCGVNDRIEGFGKLLRNA
jgi:maleate cis-trans isomerase